ncbi:hypothetical protein [Nocardioides daphniae]|nr:hypothetical protein [Nocardioides daphniae]
MDRLPEHSFAERINGCVEHAGRGVLRRQWHEGTLLDTADNKLVVSCG